MKISLLRLKHLYLAILLTALLLPAVPQSSLAAGNTYYVDPNGSDSNNGQSTSSPWQTINKVNQTTFSPGDRILFKAGGVWTGMLHPLGSGTSGSPIVIDMYGSGSKPSINGNGASAGVYLYNQQYWEINNLDVKNDNGTSSNRRGIYIENRDAGTLNHIYIRNTNVHDVYGDNTKDSNGSAGIMYAVHGSMVQSKFNDILIDNNTVGPAVDRSGIVIVSGWWCRKAAGCTGTENWYPSTNVRISNNYVNDIGGDGIVPQETVGAIVEFNTVNGFNKRSGTANAGIWAWNADNTIIQYNEAYGGTTTLDGQGFDIDYGQTGTIVQYNYSHDNQGGFILICQPSGATNDQGIVRYNISQNDQARIFQLAGPTTNTQVYNNTVYLNSSSTTSPIYAGSWGGYTKSISFKNNIFYILGAGSWTGLSNIGSFTFDYNTIYGVHTAGEPNDPHKSTADPKLSNPGSATGRSSADGYKLLAGSPAIGSGVLISNNGGKDYWGNLVAADTPPNRGADNSATIVRNPGFETGSLSPWTNWNTASVTTGNARSGNYSLQLAGGPGATEQVITVQPNTTYKLSGYAKTASSSEPVRIGVKNYGGTETWAEITSTSYTKGTVTFTTGATNTAATIYIYKPSGSNWAWGDDIAVYQQFPIVANPGFETGSLSPWTNWNTASVTTGNAFSGTYSLKLAGGPGSAEQVINVLPNTTYTVSGYAKTASSSEPVRIGVKNYGGADTSTQITSTTYTQGTVTFTTGSTNTSATIYVYKPSGSNSAWADDIAVN
jgi:hypothetical protein